MNTVTKMRLSKETMAILKNFASINSNVLIKPGNILKTVSPGMNIYVEAKVQEDFDVSVPIWDLNQFLGVVTMFNNPDLEFNESYVDISNGRSSIRYFYSEPTLLTVPPSKQFKMPNVVASFVIDEQDLNEILKASSILQVKDLTIIGEDGVLKIVVDDLKNNTSNSFSVTIDENYSGPDYRGNIDVSDVKFLPGSYKVELTGGIASKFTHQSQDLFYLVSTKRG